jgi:hypothetical protein
VAGERALGHVILRYRLYLWLYLQKKVQRAGVDSGMAVIVTSAEQVGARDGITVAKVLAPACWYESAVRFLYNQRHVQLCRQRWGQLCPDLVQHCVKNSSCLVHRFGWQPAEQMTAAACSLTAVWPQVSRCPARLPVEHHYLQCHSIARPLLCLGRTRSLSRARTHTQEMDSIWRRQWSRVMATEQRRPDPLAEFKRGKPALSDIAVYDQGTGAVPSTQGGTVAGAGGTPPRPGYGLQYPGSPGGISGAPAPSSSVPGLQTHAAPHMSAQPPAAAPHTTGDGRGIADQGIAGAPAPAGGLQGGLSGYGLAAETQAAAPGVGVSGGTSGISIQQYPGGSHVGHTTAPGAAHQQPPAPPAAAQVVSGVMGLYVT